MPTPRLHPPLGHPAADGAAPREHRQFVREVPGSAAQPKRATILIRITMPRAATPLPRAARFIV